MVGLTVVVVAIVAAGAVVGDVMGVVVELVVLTATEEELSVFGEFAPATIVSTPKRRPTATMMDVAMIFDFVVHERLIQIRATPIGQQHRHATITRAMCSYHCGFDCGEPTGPLDDPPGGGGGGGGKFEFVPDWVESVISKSAVSFQLFGQLAAA